MTFPFSSADDRTPPIDPPVIGPVVARQGQRPPPVPQQETLVPPLFVRGGSAQPSPVSFDPTEGSEREGGQAEPEMVDSSHHPITADEPTRQDDWWVESATTETGIEVSAWESSFPTAEEVDPLEDEGMPWSVASHDNDLETRGVLSAGVGTDAGDTDSPDRIADGFELDDGGPGEWSDRADTDSADEVEMGSEPASEEDIDVFGSDTVDISARSPDATSDRPEVNEWSMEETTEPWKPVTSVEDGTPRESTEALSDGRTSDGFAFTSDSTRYDSLVPAADDTEPVPNTFGTGLDDDESPWRVLPEASDELESVSGDPVFGASDDRGQESFGTGFEEGEQDATGAGGGQASEDLAEDQGWPHEWETGTGVEAVMEEEPAPTLEVATGVASVDISAATMLDLEDVDDHFRTDQPDPVEDMARRLEDMAATLRSAGATGPLTKHATDPLGALITGYLLGLTGASSEDSPPSEG